MVGSGVGVKVGGVFGVGAVGMGVLLTGGFSRGASGVLRHGFSFTSLVILKNSRLIRIFFPVTFRDLDLVAKAVMCRLST
jgi:hypothetical protein